MSLDGSRCIIGAMDGDTPLGSNSNSGKAYIFVRSGMSWTQEAILTANTLQSNSSFGRSVSMSGNGDRVVIGANRADAGGPGGIDDSGVAYVFVRSGVIWVQEASLTATDAAVSDGFGLPVAISSNGDRIAIGASAANISSTLDAGKVYIYVRSGSIWTQEAVITASDFTANDSFGIVLTINSNCDKIVIGTYEDSNSTPAKVYTFTRSGTTWTQVALNSIPYTLTISSSTLTMSKDGSRLVAGNYGPFINIGGHVS